MDFIRSLGAEAFNHKEASYQDEILAATNNQGVDIIIEMLSNVNLGEHLPLQQKYPLLIVIHIKSK